MYSSINKINLIFLNKYFKLKLIEQLPYNDLLSILIYLNFICDLSTNIIFIFHRRKIKAWKRLCNLHRVMKGCIKARARSLKTSTLTYLKWGSSKMARLISPFLMQSVYFRYFVTVISILRLCLGWGCSWTKDI